MLIHVYSINYVETLLMCTYTHSYMHTYIYTQIHISNGESPRKFRGWLVLVLSLLSFYATTTLVPFLEGYKYMRNDLQAMKSTLPTEYTGLKWLTLEFLDNTRLKQ